MADLCQTWHQRKCGGLYLHCKQRERENLVLKSKIIHHLVVQIQTNCLMTPPCL